LQSSPSPRSARRFLSSLETGCVCRLAAIAVVVFPAIAGAVEIPKLTDQLASGDLNTRREASLVLSQAGPAAKESVPALIKALGDADKQVWSNAISALANLGPDAQEAVPALIQSLGRGNGRERERRQASMRSAFALSRIGAAAVAPLITVLQSGEAGSRAGAAKALGGMGPIAAPAVPALMANLSNDEAEVRRAAADALGDIGADSLAPLRAALSSDQPRLRENAVLALGRLGPAVTPAVPALLAMFKTEPDLAVRGALFEVLPSLSVAPDQAVPLLLAGIKEESDSLRRAALNSLLMMRATHGAVVPSLIAWLKDPDVMLNARAADILARMGPVAQPAVPEIIETLVRRQPASAIYVDALAQIGPRAVPLILAAVGSDNPDSVPRERWTGISQSLKVMGGPAALTLSAALADPSVSRRLLVAQALGEIGAPANPAAAALLKACGDADARVRAKALGALVAVRADSKTILPRLESALHDSVPGVRVAALELMPSLGEKARPLSEAIIALLKDKEPSVRLRAVEAIGPGLPQAVRALIDALENAALQPAIFDALARIGPDANAASTRLFELLPSASKPMRLQILATVSKTGSPSVPPALLAALKESDVDIRAAALGAYARAGSDPAPARTALLEALNDPELNVRLAAIESLALLGNRGGDPQEVVAALTGRLEKDNERAAALDSLKKLNIRSLPNALKALAMSQAEVRLYACERLAILGAGAAEALPALRAILAAQPSDEMRRAVKRAIQQIEPH
jgi:HEAT repeat protein